MTSTISTLQSAFSAATARIRELETALAAMNQRYTKAVERGDKLEAEYVSEMVFDPTDTARFDANLQARTAIDPNRPSHRTRTGHSAPRSTRCFRLLDDLVRA